MSSQSTRSRTIWLSRGHSHTFDLSRCAEGQVPQAALLSDGAMPHLRHRSRTGPTCAASPAQATGVEGREGVHAFCRAAPFENGLMCCAVKTVRMRAANSAGHQTKTHSRPRRKVGETHSGWQTATIFPIPALRKPRFSLPEGVLWIDLDGADGASWYGSLTRR